MKKKIITQLVIWLAYLIFEIKADQDELDYYQEALYQNSYSVNDLINEGWSVVDSGNNPLNPKLYLCTDYYLSSFNGKYFTGPYTSDQTPQITFSNLPPHYEYSVYLDFIFLDNMGGGMMVVQDDSPSSNKIVSSVFPDANDVAGTNNRNYCNTGGASFYQFFQKYKHSEDSVSFQFLNQQPGKRYIIGYMQLSLATCHFSCLSCSGPFSTDCTSCPQGQVQGGVCSCGDQGYAYQNSCVTKCPDNLFPNPTTKQCESKPCGPACQKCDTDVTNLCLSCTGGFYLSEGYCVATCPTYATLQGSKCVGPIDNPGVVSGKYISKGLFAPRFSNYEITRMQFTTTGFTLSNPFTTCGGNRVFGGWVTFAQSSIILQIQNIPPHFSIHIEFKYLIVDRTYNFQYYFQLKDSTKETFQNDSSGSDMCGFSSDPELFKSFKKVYTHTTSDAQLTFSTNQSVKFFQSFGIREFIVYVEQCSSNCISCNSTKCLLCASGFYLYNSVCVQTCPSKYFPSDASPASCLNCDATCLECFGDQKDNCTKCNGLDFLQEKKCVSKCSDSYYPVYTPQYVCLKCDPTCFQCTGPSKSECTQCANPYYLTSTKCVFGSKCPIGTYPESAEWKCKDCDPSCITCTGPLDNQCSSCNAYILNGKCFSVCQSGYFGNQDLKMCEKCNQQCQECASTSTNCTKCGDPLYLTGTTCDPNCPVGYYPNASKSGNVCLQCDPKCASCSGPGPSSCKSCNPGEYLTTKSTCEKQCLSNEYQDEQRRVCKPCDKTCATCNGPYYSNCLTCTNPFFRTPGYTCEKTCPTYYYPDSFSQFCKSCHPTCLTCTGQDENLCLKCDLGRYLYNGYCKLACPEQYFENPNTQTCDPCYSNCKTCTGPNDNQCVGCKPGLYFYKNQCLPNCPDGTWANKQSMRCSPCDQTCKTCSGGSVNQCITCNVTRFLMNGQCISSCPDGLFNDIATNTCVNCHPNCKTCFERNENQCETCFPDKFLNIETHICVAKCPSGQFGDQKISSLCQTCHPSCQECFAAGDKGCSACPNNRFFVENSCLTDCTAGYFKVSGNNVCQACFSTCAHCLSPSKSACINCQPGNYFFNNQCSPQCPDGLYGNDINLNCEPCNSSCKTCTNKYTNSCTSCYTDSYLLKGICVPKCPSRYAQIGNGVNKCIECDPSCLTCSISDPTVCLTCAQGWYFLKNKCLQKCPTYYYTNSIDNTCVPCPESCEICSNPNGLEQSCIKWERNLQYTDFIMFWIVLGITIFSIVSMLIGFYLDNIIPDRQKIKIFRGKKYRLNQVAPQPVSSDPELPNAKDPKQKQDDISEFEEPQKRKGSKQLNRIDEIDSFESDPKKNKKIVFSNEEPQDNKIKNSQDPNPEAPFRKSKVTKTGLMSKFEGDIRQKSDAEVLDIIIPKSRVLNINRLLGQQSMQDGPAGPLSLAYIIDDDENKKKRQRQNEDDDSQSSQSRSRHKRENGSVTYSSAMLQNKKIQNNTTVASGWQESTLKGTKEKGRGFLRTFVEFFEVTSILVRYNEELSRPIRVLLVFSKFLFLIWISSPQLNLMAIYIFLSLVAMKMVMNGIRFALIKISYLYYKLSYICFAILVMYVVCNNVYQFYPQLDWISLNQDHNWTFIFVLVTITDFVVIQGLFIAIQYIITRYNTFSLQQTCPQRFLSIFCFDKQMSEFIVTK
ncbi:hypothetical protein TTHERM_000043859 (macronuclear) [Tetrahymena thermophila SB210]|uniref:EGF-like domain-containing protein n=1 Tax=Tetrahymena thermophila (strain SB210) TaxID=312017 RepID=W7XIF5_TETTS|nr:hypothetical protein TTHERM_000043859 [Tetrahymena thermophila SB210]EWS74596.1 hypothetical protein TTHERM_000043859 [Tetrahymena thermophila SB210]|eukprot:XP_012652818.1 hypothetical protein TTHERM_000043859 [Tetrahymena thermophila SB210]